MGGKLFCWAICRIVSHSLFCCVVLSGSYVTSIGCQFVLTGVGGCEVYGGICGCRLPVYVCFYVCVCSRDCEVKKIDVAM